MILEHTCGYGKFGSCNYAVESPRGGADDGCFIVQ